MKCVDKLAVQPEAKDPPPQGARSSVADVVDIQLGSQTATAGNSFAMGWLVESAGHAAAVWCVCLCHVACVSGAPGFLPDSTTPFQASGLRCLHPGQRGKHRLQSHSSLLCQVRSSITSCRWQRATDARCWLSGQQWLSLY